MLRLAVTIEGETRYLPLSEGVATLGSAKDNQLVVKCAGVSRRHALVERRGDRITITDAGSKNGLIVGGRRVHEVTLARETTVVLGRAAVRLNSIDSGDANVAFLLDSLVGSGDGTFDRITETASEGSDITRDVVCWIRDAEHAARTRPVLLEDARRILSATSLLVFRGGFAVDDIAGPFPPPDALRELASVPSAHWVVCEGRDLRFCAYFSDGASSSPWRRDFLAYVSSRLGERATDLPQNDEHGDLAFGDGVVQGTSAAMHAVYDLVRWVIRSDLNVLLLGENGSGKEVVAQLIHDSDPSRNGAFVPVNMTAITASMPEAELFGVEAGAATNVERRLGALRSANRGTILLDEIADTPLPLQGTLLRVVESHSVTPVGASVPEPVDVRVIAATNKDLAGLVEKGVFRRDLFFRLNGIAITVPPLRDCQEDIPRLAKAFAEAAARRFRKSVRGFTAKAIQGLLDHPWPGNVRELRSVIERAVLAAPSGGAIESAHLSLPSPALAPAVASLEAHRTAAEDSAIEDALRSADGNVTKAAKKLGVSRQTIYNKLRRKK